MFNQSAKYFQSKQDEFLFYLAGKSRDQLFADLDTERNSSLRPLFASLYAKYPAFASNSIRKVIFRISYTTSLFKSFSILQSNLSGILTR